MKCEYCLERFESEENIKEHQNTSKYCIKYKDISFTCLKCNLSTIGIKNIEKHILICDSQNKEAENINNLLTRLEKKIDILLKDIATIRLNIVDK